MNTDCDKLECHSSTARNTIRKKLRNSVRQFTTLINVLLQAVRNLTKIGQAFWSCITLAPLKKRNLYHNYLKIYNYTCILISKPNLIFSPDATTTITQYYAFNLKYAQKTFS